MAEASNEFSNEVLLTYRATTMGGGTVEVVIHSSKTVLELKQHFAAEIGCEPLHFELATEDGTILQNEWVLCEHDVPCDLTLVREVAALIPKDGLELWLDAQQGVIASEAGEVDEWSNPSFGRRRLACCDGRGMKKPLLVQRDAGPAVKFNFERFGELRGVPGECGDCLPDGVRTVISVHSFDQPPLASRNASGHEHKQFYIIAGSEQGPFHGEESDICSGHGEWAGGGAFVNGTIRLDGAAPVAVKSVTTKDFARPRMAVVQMNAPGCLSCRGPGMNRIGRDREYHAYCGDLHELLVYDHALTVEEIAIVEGYLWQRWSLGGGDAGPRPRP